MVQRRLGRAPEGMPRAQRVKSVLEDVMVGRRERHRTELVAELVDPVKFIGFAGLGAGGDQPGRLLQDPAVKGVELLEGNGVAPRFEIEEVGELEAEGISEKP